jgi:hypothetical protein
MAETAPLYFARRMGGLFPTNPAAEKALAAVDGRVRVRITSSRGNDRRMALYWIVLGLAAPMLSDLCEGDALDDTMLHRVLKDRRGLYTETVLPSGEVVRNYDSISFAKMPENERAEFITWAFETLGKWLGVPIEALTQEAERAA